MVHANLIEAAGLTYGATGALFVLFALPSAARARKALGSTSARELAVRRAKRYDLRFGILIAAIGTILLALAEYRYSAPLSLWRVPAFAAAFLASIHGTARFFALRPVYTRSSARCGLYETRR